MEDKAVDVYVLERALISTHIDSEDLVNMILYTFSVKINSIYNSLVFINSRRLL